MMFEQVLRIAATILVSLGGSGAIILGLSGWLGKVWANRLMQADRIRYERELEVLRSSLRATVDTQTERLRTELGKTIHVHRVQFEAEFSAYKDIWRTLIEVKKAVLSLRPVMDFHRPDETDEQRMQQRLSRFAGSYDQFLVTIEGSRPFYPEQVWKELEALASLLREEAINYQYKDRKQTEYWKEAQQSATRIVQHIDAVCEAIRNRIAALSVV